MIKALFPQGSLPGCCGVKSLPLCRLHIFFMAFPSLNNAYSWTLASGHSKRSAFLHSDNPGDFQFETKIIIFATSRSNYTH